VYVINPHGNGLELLSVLITNNIVGEAARVGFGSALASILLLVSLAFIVPYLLITFRKEGRR
jgi:multiple sugar transport system permease protein